MWPYQTSKWSLGLYLWHIRRSRICIVILFRMSLYNSLNLVPNMAQTCFYPCHGFKCAFIILKLKADDDPVSVGSYRLIRFLLSIRKVYKNFFNHSLCQYLELKKFSQDCQIDSTRSFQCFTTKLPSTRSGSNIWKKDTSTYCHTIMPKL